MNNSTIENKNLNFPVEMFNKKLHFGPMNLEYIDIKTKINVSPALMICAGCLFLAGLSQIVIPLPFTPVPITGQTLGIASLALGLGRNKALGSISLYLLLAAMGLPVLADGHSWVIASPTLGYLIGMFVATYVMGTLASRYLRSDNFVNVSWMKSFKRTYFVILIGSVITFSCGLIGLSFYIPADKLLVAGLFPFIPGDLVKTFLAALIFYPRGSK